MLGKVIRLPFQHPLHNVSFDSCFRPATDHYIRRKGRPHKEWIPDVYKSALRLAGSLDGIHAANVNKLSWSDFLKCHLDF